MKFHTLYIIALALALPFASSAMDPRNGDFTKATPGAIRVMSYNTHGEFLVVAGDDDEYKRIFEALKPDIVVFNEIDLSVGSSAALAAAAIKTRLETYAPAGTWNVWCGTSDGFIRNGLASRYPLSMTITDTTPASELRGVTAALVDIPGTPDLYVMGVHMKSGGTTGAGGDYQRRQVHADALTRWMSDARTAGGSINLPTGTPMVIVGDTNMGFNDEGDEAPYHPAKTLLDGDIFDNATYGADSAPDWDGSNNTDAAPYDHNNGNPRSWSASASATSRFDRMYFTDSVMRVDSRFLLNCSTMTPAALTAAGLVSTDTSIASDHMPTVVDFVMGASPAPGNLLVNEFLFNDLSTDDRNFVELINTGGQEVNLDAPIDYRLKVSNAPLPTAAPGAENENESILVDLKGTVPAGGLFVVYDSATDSAGIATAITTALTDPLNRQNIATFNLTNADDTALALVQVGKSDISVTQDTSADAYLYAATTPATTRFFRTNSGNGLTISLGTAQQSTFGAGGAQSDSSAARGVGNSVANTYTGWAVPATATPGLPNGVTAVGEWSLFD